MPKVALTGGAYQARSVIAAAQRALNLYAEPLPQSTGERADARHLTQWAHFPTPGLTLLGTLPQGPVRAIRQCTTGGVYAVGGSGVYLVNTTNWTNTHLGDITALRTTPVSMIDNGSIMVIVDGTSGGWTVDLASHTFAPITDPAFAGADKVDFLDTFFLFNKPNTPQMYWSLSESASFDDMSLDFGNKEIFSDLLVTIAVAKREIWMLGERTTEIWADVGASSETDITFSQFQPIQSVFVDHGIRAKYSAATYDNAVYWLAYDRAGQGIVISGAGYQTRRISTFPIEAELTKYSRIDDAIGFTYSLGGHVYYVLSFPSADRTWVYDITTQQWHEWLWVDTDGTEHRHRANCCYPCNGILVAGDHDNGNLYRISPECYTDVGQPIKRVRSFPHIVSELDRVFYRQFIADIECGNDTITCAAQDGGGTPTTPYTAPRAQINTNLGGLYRSGTAWGFPANTNFSTMLMSYWMCGPYNPTSAALGSPGIWPAFMSARFFTFGAPDTVYVGPQFLQIGNASLGTTPVFTGDIPNPLPTSPTGCLLHFMLSVDTLNQIVQVYINDQPIPISNPTWIGSPPHYFYINSSINNWSWDVSNVIHTGNYPAIADVWISNTPSFVDLSLNANRRKFINADLTGVDLGNTGTTPFGYQPAMYMAVRSGGVATDILINRGIGGGTWAYNQNPPTLQAPGACIAPSPGTPPGQVPLAPPDRRIYLRWSDDRGRSFGNPVAQDFGNVGQYNNIAQFQRLGYARDRVFELFWSAPIPTALLGAYIEVSKAQS